MTTPTKEVILELQRSDTRGEAGDNAGHFPWAEALSAGPAGPALGLAVMLLEPAAGIGRGADIQICRTDGRAEQVAVSRVSISVLLRSVCCGALTSSKTRGWFAAPFSVESRRLVSCHDLWPPIWA